ncbi:MAG: dihydrodipicolinate synthase family protein, partial [Deinococcus sp.]|nr:dihydrodipicolinate synthase family protein [Deinococcus sp.]
MFRGILVPITTPFTEGKVQLGRLEENLQKWNQTSLSGYVVLGSTGEFPYLDEQERESIIAAARAATPREKALLAGTGWESTAATIRFTQRASELGADAALVVTPSYYQGHLTPQVLEEHYLAVAESSPIPVLLYNVPQFTGVNLLPETVCRLAKHPRIQGIKDSSGNLTQLAEILKGCGGNFPVLTGAASILLGALVLGASGAVLGIANVAPERCVEVYNLFQAGKLEEARARQLELLALARGVGARFGVGGIKAAMDLVGYWGGLPRRPL